MRLYRLLAVLLARYLGLTLVEGSDLTVRDQRVYLKTLRGLEPQAAGRRVDWVVATDLPRLHGDIALLGNREGIADRLQRGPYAEPALVPATVQVYVRGPVSWSTRAPTAYSVSAAQLRAGCSTT